MKKYIRFAVPVLFYVILFSLYGCEKENSQKLAQKNWQLVWSDEFDSPAGSSPDASKWSFDIGTGNGGWGNAELEYYTSRISNVSTDGNGSLAITAKSESYSGSAFTSARIKTAGLFDQGYGRFEARIKLPWGPGIWPAFWLLGSNAGTDGWPECGEIDIMELRGQKPDIISGTVHGPGYSGAASLSKSYALMNDRFDVNYHLFAVEWGEKYLDFYVDDILYQRVTPEMLSGEWVFDHPFYIILNVAVGGNYVGFPTSQTPFPQTMFVDYVRVYKENN